MDGPFMYEICTADQRLDCWTALQDPNHPLNKAWPHFLDNDPFQKEYADQMLQYVGLRRFQFGILEQDAQGGETMIACARSIPFFWPELECLTKFDPSEDARSRLFSSLPDEGWDWVVACGVQQYCTREDLPIPPFPTHPVALEKRPEAPDFVHHLSDPPNALSALSITVREDRRNQGFAEQLIDAMKQTAQQERLRILIAPLRPTRKTQYASVDMETYVSWTLPRHLDQPCGSTIDNTPSLGAGRCCAEASYVPFDPWLRKHIRLGGRVAKIAPASMGVCGSFTEWQAWTGIDFRRLRHQSGQSTTSKAGGYGEESYWEITIPGGLVPLKVFPSAQICVYIEPNVWLYHSVEGI
ncbi:MAG: hypothetical protein Q9202_006374 [Teloschistes flavicans]